MKNNGLEYRTAAKSTFAIATPGTDRLARTDSVDVMYVTALLSSNQTFMYIPKN
jgi:hypothetical protein